MLCLMSKRVTQRCIRPAATSETTIRVNGCSTCTAAIATRPASRWATAMVAASASPRETTSAAALAPNRTWVWKTGVAQVASVVNTRPSETIAIAACSCGSSR